MLLFLPAAFLVAFVSGCRPDPPNAMTHEAYVWQRSWTASTTQAMSEAADLFGGWRILVAQADAPGAWSRFPRSQAQLATLRGELRAVVRIDGGFPPGDIAPLVDGILASWSGLAPAAWTGLEVDFDCPTRSLPQYARMLVELRRRLPSQYRLSVTALPAWLASPELARVLDAADESVLQVHSVLDPHRGLLDPALALEWVDRYADVSRRPFRVALPAYGSRVSWDPSGRLASIVSEQVEVRSPPTGQELEAPPQVVAELLARLSARHPRHMLGIAWFRLPTREDQRSWSLATLRRVIQGKPLVPERSLHVEQDGSRAFRISIVNSGEVDFALPRAVLVPPCRAAGALEDFHLSRSGDALRFERAEPRMLRSGRSATVGWSRCELGERDIHVEDGP